MSLVCAANQFEPYSGASGKFSCTARATWFACGLRNESRPNQHRGNEAGRCRGQHAQPSPRRRETGRLRPRQQGIERRHQKRQPINSGDACQLNESQICRRWITQQIPRKTYLRQTRAHKFETSPTQTALRYKPAATLCVASRCTIHANIPIKIPHTAAISSSTPQPPRRDTPP